MKTAIVYYSRHHENTKKLLDTLTGAHEITLIDATKCQKADLSQYDLVGFASGIYYSKFHKSVLRFASENLPAGKPVFFLYTYGAAKEGYTRAIEKITAEKQSPLAGSFGCLGFNTFGPFKLMGGMAKGHPTQGECEKALAFYESLLKDLRQL